MNQFKVISTRSRIVVCSFTEGDNGDNGKQNYQAIQDFGSLDVAERYKNDLVKAEIHGVGPNELRELNRTIDDMYYANDIKVGCGCGCNGCSFDNYNDEYLVKLRCKGEEAASELASMGIDMPINHIHNSKHEPPCPTCGHQPHH